MLTIDDSTYAVMQCSLTNGGNVIFAWPRDITPWDADHARAVVALQMKTIGRHAKERDDAEVEFSSWAVGATAQGVRG